MAYAIDTRIPGGLEAGRIGRVRAAIADRLARYATYRTTLAELDSLSDRDLADLGIARADIHALAREAAMGK
jgi:uncharacterized protein YjiS (DUF1127 family)